MTTRQKARKLRNYLKVAGNTEALYKKHKESFNKNNLETMQADKAARAILETVRVYEEYMKLMEAELKAKIKFGRGKYVRTAEKLKETQRELLKYQRSALANRAVSGKHDMVVYNPKTTVVTVKGGQPIGIKPPVVVPKAEPKTTVIPPDNDKGRKPTKEEMLAAMNQRMADTADAIAKRFEEFKKIQESAQRGDNLGESLGKSSHPDKDPYDKLLDILERDGHLVLTMRAQEKLANTELFRVAFNQRFKDKMSPQELENLGHENFVDRKYVVAPVNVPQEYKNINWSKKRKDRS